MQCSQIHGTKISGEAASADIEVTRVFTAEFKKIIEDNDFLPDLVFNVDETGLYWEMLPSRTYISREEKSVPGFKASEDRLNLLLGRKALNSVALVRTRTIPTERPPPVGEVSANFCGYRGVTWSAQRVPTAVNLCFLDLEPLLFSFK